MEFLDIRRSTEVYTVTALGVGPAAMRWCTRPSPWAPCPAAYRGRIRPPRKPDSPVHAGDLAQNPRQPAISTCPPPPFVSRLPIIHDVPMDWQAPSLNPFVYFAQFSHAFFSFHSFLHEKENLMQVLAISGVRCYNIRVGFCPDGGRLHAYVKVRVFHKRGQVFLRSQQNQVLQGRILPTHAKAQHR